MKISKQCLLSAAVLSAATAVLVLLIFYQQITGPSPRWEDALSREKLTAQFGDIKTIRRSRIWAYLGKPDEPNRVKQYDLWSDDDLFGKYFDVVYDAEEYKEKPDHQDPIAIYMFYQCTVILFYHKFILNSSQIDLELL
ncbi:hypothetical protein [Mesorhizobium sp. M0701]|uniref:hypothetical protein n=1 Tax=Mesorhizobium sp. M0701 TaxID=2956989 RepID=UPI00333B24F0